MGIDPQFLAGAASVTTAWLWKEFGKDLIQKAASNLWMRFKFNDAKQKYQTSIKKLHSTIRILDKLETVPLADNYVDLFILEEPEAYRKYGVEHLESNFDETTGFYNRGNRTDALVIANEYDHLLVLGKPGAGKTTFLKYIASLAAEEKIDKVPIFISFNNWAYSQKQLLDFIVEQFEICGFPDAREFIELLLDKGNSILLFDGLDEVSEEGDQRGKMIYELENLVKQYPNNKFIVTCRNAANEYKFDGFTYVEIADLTITQVSVFVKKWFNNNSNKATEFLTQLDKEEHQSLKELSHNPLLLGMLCLVFEEKSHFPSKRGIVYQEAIDALIKRWDKERGIQRNKIPGFSPSYEKELLAFLAYKYSLENKVFFEQDNIEKKIKEHSTIISSKGIESNDVLTAIEVQHGLLAQRARHVYTFSHLTFQEYFTAQYIIDQFEADKYLLDDLFTRLYNQRWREVFPLVAGLIPNPDSFFEKFTTRIRESIKKDKVLTRVIKNIDKFAVTLQGDGDIITARMRAIALATTLSRMLHIVHKSANKRSPQIARKVLSLLNIDESVVNILKATESAEIITMGSIYKGNNREKVNKMIKLAAKHSEQTDFDMGHSYSTPIINLDNIRASLREQLKITDESLTQQTKQKIQKTLEAGLIIDTSFKITLDFKPNITKDFVENMKGLDFPKTFADEEEWRRFKKNTIQSIAPEFSERILELKEEHLPILEQFIKGNIFLLDCLQQSNFTDYSNFVFTLKSLPF